MEPSLRPSCSWIEVKIPGGRLGSGAPLVSASSGVHWRVRSYLPDIPVSLSSRARMAMVSALPAMCRRERPVLMVVPFVSEGLNFRPPLATTSA